MTTISNYRLKVLERFDNNYINDWHKANYIINSYYRLCGLSTTLLYRDNDAYLHDRPYTIQLHDKEDRWVIRLNKVLKPYGLKLRFFSWLPSICDSNDNRVYEPMFYN